MGVHGGSFAQRRLPGLENTYQPIRRWEIRQHPPIDRGATKEFNANTDMKPENTLVLVSPSTRIPGILTIFSLCPLLDLHCFYPIFQPLITTFFPIPYHWSKMDPICPLEQTGMNTDTGLGQCYREYSCF